MAIDTFSDILFETRTQKCASFANRLLIVYRIMSIHIFLLLIITLIVIAAEKARFDNYRVYSIEIENEEQLQMVQQLENHQDGLLFLIPPLVVPMRVEVVVPPHKFADISELCEKSSIKNEIKIDNLQKYIRKVS